MATIEIKITGDSRSAVNAINQTNSATKRYTGNAKKADKETSAWSKTSSALGKALPVVAITAATAAVIKYGAESARIAAESQRLEMATQNLGRQFGITSDEIVDAITFASGETISDMSAMQAANQAMLFDVATSTEQFQELTAVAVGLGRAMGQDATKSMEDLTLALGRQSPLILDNLGIQLSLTDAYSAYAIEVGKGVNQLTEAEKQQAFVNAALDAGREKLGTLGGVQEDTLAKQERLNASYENFRVALGETDFVTNSYTGTLNFATETLTLFTDVLQGNALSHQDAAMGAEEDASATDQLAMALDNASGAAKDFSQSQEDLIEQALDHAKATTELNSELSAFFNQLDQEGQEAITSQADVTREIVSIRNEANAEIRQLEQEKADELARIDEDFTERAIAEAQRRSRMSPELAAVTSQREIEIAGQTRDEALAETKARFEEEIAEQKAAALEKTTALQNEFLEEKTIREQAEEDRKVLAALQRASIKGELDQINELQDLSAKEIAAGLEAGTVEFTTQLQAILNANLQEIESLNISRESVQRDNSSAIEAILNQEADTVSRLVAEYDRLSRAQDTLNFGNGVTATVLAPARQHGGPVWPGQGFMVGEAGPELFSPSQPGTIVPNQTINNTTNNFNSTFQTVGGNVQQDFRMLQTLAQ